MLIFRIFSNWRAEKLPIDRCLCVDPPVPDTGCITTQRRSLKEAGEHKEFELLNIKFLQYQNAFCDNLTSIIIVDINFTIKACNSTVAKSSFIIIRNMLHQS